MKRTAPSLLAVTVALLFATVTVATAKVPPPPVNQYLGLYDTDFGALTRSSCLACHGSDQVLVLRHHALLNNVAPAKTYDCLTCHTLVPDGSGGYLFADFRTCENCHSTSPHHTTTAAVERHCTVCHGSFVDDYDDGHPIPTYTPSAVTPGITGDAYTDPVTGEQKITGGCGACHQPDATAIDPATGTVRPILSNRETHHATHLACATCHPVHGGVLDIRGCESCHGIRSLHNIQQETPAPANVGTVVPGQEEAGWGHVGSNSDCNGCHLPAMWAASATPAGATVPAIGALSSRTVRSDRSTLLTIAGDSLVNSAAETTYTPTILLGSGPTAVTLQPSSVSANRLQVVIPPLPPGNYDLRVVKADKRSNRARLTVALLPAVKQASLTRGTDLVTIIGSGFGTPPPGDYASGLGVFANGAAARIVTWSATRIIVTSPGIKAGALVTVKTVNGSATAKVLQPTTKTRR
ncbi:cytochrome c [Geotalea uraniireducens]|uniref:Cytochrome c n=1 Tax=Geotalea uraniireducens TaxID=351604 RepID=A0ABN6VR39_9BACT|nr:IPT/TIG domain-containing protein [Geotalea uraniireducens]BDV42803.1 cytochrome c [Geotalea uraniireducens]